MEKPNIRSAVIHFFGENEAFRPTTSIAGIELIRRALLTAQRAGIEKFYLARQEQAEITRCIESEQRLKGAVQWIDLTDIPKIEEPRILVIGLYQLLHPRGLQNFLSNTEQELAATWKGDILPLAVVESKNLQQALQSEQEFKALTQKLPKAQLSEFCVAVCGPRRDVEKKLLQNLQSPLEGTVDVYFNRPLGRLITIPLARLHANPNVVSIISILFGLTTAVLFLLCGYASALVGAIFLQISAIIDCIDGDIARLQFKESKLGRWLDISGDNIVHLAVFVCLGIREYQVAGNFTPVILGAMLGIGTIISFTLVVYSQVRLKPAAAGSDLSNALVKLQNFIDRMTSRDFTVLLILCAALGKLIWFLWAAAIGTQIFWMLLLLWTLSVRRKIRAAEVAS